MVCYSFFSLFETSTNFYHDVGNQQSEEVLAAIFLLYELWNHHLAGHTSSFHLGQFGRVFRKSIFNCDGNSFVGNVGHCIQGFMHEAWKTVSPNWIYLNWLENSAKKCWTPLHVLFISNLKNWKQSMLFESAIGSICFFCLFFISRRLKCNRLSTRSDVIGWKKSKQNNNRKAKIKYETKAATNGSCNESNAAWKITANTCKQHSQNRVRLWLILRMKYDLKVHCCKLPFSYAIKCKSIEQTKRFYFTFRICAVSARPNSEMDIYGTCEAYIVSWRCSQHTAGCIRHRLWRQFTFKCARISQLSTSAHRLPIFSIYRMVWSSLKIALFSFVVAAVIHTARSQPITIIPMYHEEPLTDIFFRDAVVAAFDVDCAQNTNADE